MNNDQSLEKRVVVWLVGFYEFLHAIKTPFITRAVPFRRILGTQLNTTLYFLQYMREFEPEVKVAEARLTTTAENEESQEPRFAYEAKWRKYV